MNTKSEQQIRVYERGTEHEENQFGVNKRGDEILLETTQIKQRLPFIDLIRGITIIEMISYHFLWDLVYLYNADIPWYKSHGAYIWQQSICWTFILLAGFSWHLGKKHMKRGLWAFGGGVIVSLVTAIVLPNDRVRYGVLTLIGSCILIWILLDKVLKKIPAGVGVSVSFVLFLILRSWTKQDPIAHTVQQRVKLPPPGGFLRIAVREEKLIYRNMIPGYKVIEYL